MNLAQSVALADMRRQGQASPLPKAAKTHEQVCNILASHYTDPQAWLVSSEFILMDVPVHFASTPYLADKNEVLGALHASANGYSEIIIDVNKRGVGKSFSGFSPSVVVLKGQAIVQAARLAGRETVPVWIGNRAVEKLNLIHADHQLSSSELNSKLQLAHNQRSGIGDDGRDQTGTPVDYGKRPHVGDVYPMENYHIFQQGGQNYKQKHSVDLAKRQVKLVGSPQPVKQKWVDMKAAKFRYRKARGGSEHKPGVFPHVKFGREAAEGNLSRHQEAFSRRTDLKEQIPKEDGKIADADTKKGLKANTVFPNNPGSVRNGMRIDNAAQLYGFGGGNASGPPYSSGLGTQPAAEKTSMKLAKKKTVKSFAGTEMTDEALTKHRGASGSELRKRFEKSGSKARPSGLEGSGGYTGYDKATPAFKQKTRGASNSEMGPRLAAAVEDFEAAVADGYKVRDMKNTAPPGMEHVVQALKNKYGEKSSKPFQIAWHMHEKKSKD